jgi:hypothetical protein
MHKTKNFVRFFLIGLMLVGLVACTHYETQVIPFKMPSAYPNATELAGAATIAAKAYDDPAEAEKTFGLDIRSAKILPVQVIFDNRSSHPLEIVYESTYLVDTENNLWPILDANLTYDRIAKKTEMGEVLPEAAKSGVLAGAAGAVIGAAVGIVTGTNVGDAAMKGAAVGAAAGATMGGAKGLSDTDVQRKIREDLRTRSLERKAMPAQEVSYGFIFFPGEAKKVKELRLRVREADSGQTYPTIFLKF